MKLFILVRDNDLTGISGTGIVAQGVVLPSGKVVMEWRKPHQSIGIYENIGEVEAIHGHNGATRIVFNAPILEGQIVYSADGWYDAATGEKLNTQELGRRNMEGRE